MKKILLIFVLFTTLCFAESTFSKIKAYAGKNADALTKYYEQAIVKSSYMGFYETFIIENAAPEDLAVFTPEMLKKNVELALKTKEFAFTKEIPIDVFKHFVLPLRISQEPFEDWREPFYNELKEKVKNITNLEEAAVIVDLYTTEQVYFKQTSGRDQAPLTTKKRGYGRCEEIMISLTAALRSVGIPARSASAPFWNFTDNNHAWVEIWTPNGWKLMEGGIPITGQSNHWVPNNTRRTTLVEARAYGAYDSPNALQYENNVTTINSTAYYTKTSKVNIKVVDEEGKGVPAATVSFYAVSYGGLFNLHTQNTDEKGFLEIDLGKSTAIVVAGKNGKTAIAKANMLDGDVDLTLKITDKKVLDEEFAVYFTIPYRVEKECEKVELENYKMLKELANLRRDKRLLTQKKPEKFISYLKKGHVKDFELAQKLFVEKTAELAGASEDYAYVYSKIAKNNQQVQILNKMILNWDIKDLIEMPDTTAILTTVTIFDEAKNRFKSVPDSVFYENVLLSPFGRVMSPQNGWRKSFYSKIKHLAVKNDIEKTVKNLQNWLNEVVNIEDNHEFGYFTGSINPNQILNMKNISGYHKLILTSNALRLLGVPLQWKGFMLYYNGSKFVQLNAETDDKKENQVKIPKQLVLTLSIDEKEAEPKPYSNFLLATLTDDGIFSHTYFKPEIKNNKATLYYFVNNNDDRVYIQSYIRNQNGDADLKVKQVVSDSMHIALKTLEEYISTEWNKKTLANVKQIYKGKRIVFVRNKIETEPEIRMLEQFVKNEKQYYKKGATLVVYSENRKNPDLANKRIITLNGEKVVTEKLNPSEFPAVFVFDENNKMVFTSKGYDMGIADYLQRKLK